MRFQMNDVNRKTYTVEEAARILGVSKATIYKAVQESKIPSIRLGRRILVPEGLLMEMLGETNDHESPVNMKSLDSVPLTGDGRF